MRGTLLAFAVSAVALNFAAGCGQDTGKGIVKGRVTLDGVPVEKGVVQFFPVDGKTPTGKPGMIDKGNYTAEVPVGTMTVVINSAKKIGQHKSMPDSPAKDIFDEGIPAKYNRQTVLKKDIHPGENEINFELTTR